VIAGRIATQVNDRRHSILWKRTMGLMSDLDLIMNIETIDRSNQFTEDCWREFSDGVKNDQSRIQKIERKKLLSE
jgi:hypothetical protein